MQTSIWNNSSAPHKSFSGNDTVDSSMRSPFGEEVDAQIRQHAIEAYPEESCGIIVDGVYIRSRNVHKSPTDFFEIEPELLQTFASRLEGMAHSHPKVMPWPSAIDMQQQDLWDVPWAIASVAVDADKKPFVIDMFWFGDTLPTLPLLNRAFRPGIQDCFAVARDYFRNEGYDVPVMPRDAEWWIGTEDKPRQNLFVDMLEDSGFERISFSQIEPGDGFACPYGTQVICHCGVLLPREKVLHHFTGKRSTVEAAYKWVKRTIEGGQFFRIKGKRA